ncbi:MAG TPA: twin transmembrane helix small protein [Gammaproteobacteria bacterium]|jgi:hypothetical protein
MLARLIVIVIFLAILASLFSGMYFMLHDKSASTRNVKALTVRIVLSLLALGFLVFAYYMGWIQPNRIHP